MHYTHIPVYCVQVYERAVSNLPPGNDKRFWRRYIYLWIKYALFEELDAQEPERAREVYRYGVWCGLEERTYVAPVSTPGDRPGSVAACITGGALSHALELLMCPLVCV